MPCPECTNNRLAPCELIDGVERAVCGVFGLPGESLQSGQRTKNI